MQILPGVSFCGLIDNMSPQDLRISGRTTANGYVYLLIKEHPFASKKGYVYEHRFVVECELGRFLTEDEVVHHRNHDKQDNRPENLEVKSPVEHAREHGAERTSRATTTLVCPMCEESFERLLSRTKRSERLFCSRSCNMRFNRLSGAVNPRASATHGSSSMYGYHGCRCDRCKEGQRDRARARRLKQKNP